VLCVVVCREREREREREAGCYDENLLCKAEGEALGKEVAFFCDLQNGKKEGTWEGIRKGRNWIKVVGRYLV
jgi:hypothetical protein